jgi:hypothetical protein
MNELMLLSLLIFAVTLCIAAGSVFLLCCKLVILLVQRNKLMKKQIQLTKKNVERKYNKIATMDVNELDTYLTGILSICIQIAYDADISEKDPDAEEKLYFSVLQRLQIYLGNDTVQAIEYFYGPQYLSRWVQLRYTYLSKTGALAKLIAQKPPITDDIMNNLNKKDAGLQ